MRLVLLLASIATAQVRDGVSIRSTNNDLNIARRQVISISEMSSRVAAAAAEFQDIRAAISGGTAPVIVGAQALANDMTSRSNNLFTMATANTVALGSMQTTIANAQATMTLQGQNIEAAVSQQAQAIQESVASQATAIAADTSTQLATAAGQLAAVRSTLTAVRSSIATATNSINAEVEAVASNITALPTRVEGKLISHQQCEHRGENGADSSSTIVLTCNFVKARNDTFWMISHSADTRQISGSSNWRIEVDGQPCRNRANNNRGSIDAAFHGVGPNMHRPMYERGICYRTTNQAVIRAGTHSVRWRQTRTSGDSYWGWNSNAQIMVEEWLP